MTQLVSIQLMSPASGDLTGTESPVMVRVYEVSIQLMSPASGDVHAGMIGNDHQQFPFN